MKKILILISLFALFSCETKQNNEITETNETKKNELETKEDYMMRVFNEENGKFIYYEGKFLEALNLNNLKLMKIYRDSVKMSSYTICRVFYDMYPNKK